MTVTKAPAPMVAEDWTGANQRYLAAAVEVVRELLIAHAQRSTLEAPPEAGLRDARARLLAAGEDLPAPSALESLSAAFGLSGFERDLLVLCAGVELNGDFARDVAAAQGDPRRVHPTFGLAMAALPEAHWSALTPAAPLRRWRMIEILHGDTLTSSPLRIDERVLHHLTGVSQLDERLTEVVRPAEGWDGLPPRLHALADRLAALLSATEDPVGKVRVALTGTDASVIEAVATHACQDLALGLQVMQAGDGPTSPSEREALARLIEREAILGRTLTLIRIEDADTPELERGALALIRACGVPIMLASRDTISGGRVPMVTVPMGRTDTAEQRELWGQALGTVAAELDGELDPILAQFSLGLPAMRAASAPVLTSLRIRDDARSVTGEDLGRALWDACREQSRSRLDDLTQRIDPVAGWEDIVLPEPQRDALRQIAAQVRHRALVYDEWGFAARSERGLGISVLFAGASGTGKTMAAEVLARDLRLDLYRVDLSQVVSKYIGETEKNLRRVFDAAEEGGAVLLFDEADALFGKRSEVKDSHDRYANIEVSYLLQRMEAYRGLAILTTNMKSALDPAFLRRLRFVVQFPFPEAVQRAEIWRRTFTDQTPTEDLQPELLARLGVAGGNIHNIALNAAFLAAGAGEPVRMGHVLLAARAEYAKLEKPLTDSEIGGWQ